MISLKRLKCQKFSVKQIEDIKKVRKFLLSEYQGSIFPLTSLSFMRKGLYEKHYETYNRSARVLFFNKFLFQVT